MLEEAIKQAIEIELKRATEIAVENAKKEIERRIPEIVAGIAIKTMEHVSLQRNGKDLMIHIKFEN